MMQSCEPLNADNGSHIQRNGVWCVIRSYTVIQYYCTVERTVRTYDATSLFPFFFFLFFSRTEIYGKSKHGFKTQIGKNLKMLKTKTVYTKINPLSRGAAGM